MPTILDFQITPKAKKQFTLEIFERDKTKPLAKSTFDYDLSYLTGYEISGLDFDTRDPAARLERIKTFGGKQYQKLFSPEIEKIWQRYKATSDFLILCLRIAPDKATVGLEAIPWETLFDGDEFLAAGAKTGLSRLPYDIAPQDDCQPVAPPLKMLAFLASPLDLQETERLQIEREQEILLQAVNTPAGQGKLTIEFEDEAKLTVLESSWETPYHIFHYTGHGIPPEKGGGLLLEDAGGKKRPTGVPEILSVLQKGEQSLRLAVISGCQTARTLHVAGFRDLARGLIRRNIPGVIAMQFSISDAAGLLFAETLYPRLIAGQPLELAMSATRRELLHHDDHLIQADAFAPVLFTSQGECLELAAAEKPAATEKIKIDFSFFLPLPQLSFGFYGRRKECRQVRDGLLFQNHRAVIVHGIGGIGKTALASHIATRLKNHFQGVYAFDCSSGALAPERILLELHRYFERQGIKVLEQLVHAMLPPDQSATYLAQLLSQYSLLLIFDNFETQLLITPEADAVGRNSDFRIRNSESATSQTADRQLPTEDCQLATADCQLLTEDCRLKIADDNLRLFLSTLVKATKEKTRFIFTCRFLFELDEKRVGAVQELPLGDLSRPEALGLMQKLPHLSNSAYDEKIKAFEVFGGHPYALIALDRHCAFQPLDKIWQDASAVHAELRRFIAIELNYRRLSERARELLDRLAAFRVPVPVDAAEWVLGEPEQLSELSGVSQLSKLFANVDRSQLPEEWKNLNEGDLLRIFEEYLPEQRVAKNLDQPIAELIAWGLLTPIMDDGDLQALSVHSLVRDFCREQECGESWQQRLRDAAAFYTNQSRFISQDEKTPAAIWSEMEAFELLLEASDYADASNLLMDLDPVLDRWGFGRYLESQYRRLLEKVDPKLKSKIEHNIGILIQSRGDYGAALDHYQRSLQIAEELGDRAGVSKSLHQIGMIHEERGDYGAALEHYQRSLQIAEELGDRAGVSKSLHQIGMIHEKRGDYGAARDHYQRSLQIAEELGDRAGVSYSKGQIGTIYLHTGQYELALQNYEEVKKISEELGDKSSVSKALHQIGNIHYYRGDYGAALEHYQRSLQMKEELGDRDGVSTSLHQIGLIHQYRGDYGAALDHYQRALQIAEELGDRAGVSKSLHQIGMIHEKRGDYGAALDHYQRALKIEEELGDRAGVSQSLHQIGMIHQYRGDYGAALDHYQRSLQIAEELGDRAGVAESKAQIGKLLTLLKRYSEALEDLLFALTTFVELGSPNAEIVGNMIKELRENWGAKKFDAAWEQATGEKVPEWVRG